MKSDFRNLKIILENALIYNPVLTQIIGLCSVIAIATTLKDSVIVALVSAVLVIIMETLASAFMKKIVRYIRVAVYFIISIIILAPLLIVLENQTDELSRNISIILPLLAVSSFVVVRCEKFAVKNSIKASVVDSIASAIGYGTVVIAVGAVRELLGKGSIWGITLFENPPLPGFAQPFGGFVVVGFFAVALSMIVEKYFPAYSEDIIFRFKTERPKYKISYINPDKEREESVSFNEPKDTEIAEEILSDQPPEELDESENTEEPQNSHENYVKTSYDDFEEKLFSRSVEDILGNILNKTNSEEEKEDSDE